MEAERKSDARRTRRKPLSDLTNAASLSELDPPRKPGASSASKRVAPNPSSSDSAPLPSTPSSPDCIFFRNKLNDEGGLVLDPSHALWQIKGSSRGHCLLKMYLMMPCKITSSSRNLTLKRLMHSNYQRRR
ncbi:hypothetical protein BT93_C2522 [Corymbia citriodora subsp. variegata]|nr:hypothetical protein BT93_C2522 [Corymbia citriodora subsp. variegata]